MQLAVDGVIFEIQNRGGISRLFSTILPLMCDLDPNLQVTLYLARRPRRPLPVHPQIRTRPIVPLSRILQPARYWRQIVPMARSLALALGVDRRENTVWHSTYFTHPLGRSLPSVVTIYDLINERYSELFDPIDVKLHISSKKRLLDIADRVICISETTAADVQSIYGVSRDKIEVIHLAPSLAFQPSRNAELPSVHPYLLYVGSRSPYKNFSTLLAAYDHWSPTHPVDLVVVGSPWKDDEVRQLTEHCRRDRIRLLTDVNDDQLAALYRGALAFVYPSLYEGFGIPLLEAMACGCPIVASRIPSSVEVAGDCPVYFDPLDEASLIEALDQTMLVQGRIARTQAGIERAAEFSWNRTARATLAVYHSILTTQ